MAAAAELSWFGFQTFLVLTLPFVHDSLNSARALKSFPAQRRKKRKMKVLKFIIDLPLRFVFALIGFTFLGWIGWVGIVLIALKLFGVIGWPWWVATLPLEYGVLYCLYMTIDGALYRAGLKNVGGYARGTSDPSEVERVELLRRLNK
jgi:hypothetical protein